MLSLPITEVNCVNFKTRVFYSPYYDKRPFFVIHIGEKQITKNGLLFTNSDLRFTKADRETLGRKS